MATNVSAHWTKRIVWLVVPCLWFAHAARGQQATLVLPSAERLLREAYAQTKTAARESDLTEIIRMCGQARHAKPSDSVAAYADELAAWAHNRRGELQAKQALDLAQQARPSEAAELDAQALADFETAVRMDPKNWKPLHNRGVSRALANRLDEALEDFSRVIELKPDYANAWFNRAEIRAERDELEEAVMDYTQAIKLKPEDTDACLRRGQAYVHLRKFREALADYDRAVKLAPDKIGPLLDRGDVHRSLGQWQLAAEDYRRAVALDHRSSRAYQSAAWILATCPLDRFRNVDLAIQAAERALELDDDKSVEYLDTVAAAYANAGQFEKARETLARAIDMAPAHAETFRRRLELYQKQQPYREPQPVGTAAP
jgi:tetratricopeptide (TPR) repeat protein